MSKCCLADIGEVIEHHRRVGRHLAHLGALVVEHPQRVDLGASPGFLVEVELEQEVLQQFPVLRPAAVVAQRGDLQPEPVESQRAETGVGDRDHLGVQRRVVDADRLDPDLLQLPVAAGLRALVPEERPRVAELDRQRPAVEAVLDHRAHHTRGALRPQRHRAVAAVGEGVHLLATPRRWTPRRRGRTARCPRRSAVRCRRSRRAGRRRAGRRARRRTAPSPAAGNPGRPWAPEIRSLGQAFEERVGAAFEADGGLLAVSR